MSRHRPPRRYPSTCNNWDGRPVILEAQIRYLHTYCSSLVSSVCAGNLYTTCCHSSWQICKQDPCHIVHYGIGTHTLFRNTIWLFELQARRNVFKTTRNLLQTVKKHWDILLKNHRWFVYNVPLVATGLNYVCPKKGLIVDHVSLVFSLSKNFSTLAHILPALV